MHPVVRILTEEWGDTFKVIPYGSCFAVTVTRSTRRELWADVCGALLESCGGDDVLDIAAAVRCARLGFVASVSAHVVYFPSIPYEHKG